MTTRGANTENGLTIISRSLLRTTAADWASPETLFMRLKGVALSAILVEDQGTMSSGGGVSYDCRRALLMFDCMLRVIDEPEITSVLQFPTKRFGELQDIFYGALTSHKFCDAEQSSRTSLAHAFYRLIRSLRKQYEVRESEYTPNSNKNLPKELSNAFDALKLNAVEIEKLQPFMLVANDGTRYNVMLKPMRSYVGQEFTQRFYAGLCAIAKPKAKDALLRDFGSTFSRFVVTQAETEFAITESKLNDSDFVQTMLVDFMEYHFMKMTRMKGGAQEGTLGSLQKSWSNYIAYWKLLAKNKIVAAPSFAYPEGNPKLRNDTEVRHQRTTTADNGSAEMVTHKLITPVPLHLSDEEATNLIFCKIKADLAITQVWLDNRLNELWLSYQEGKAIAAASPLALVRSNTSFDDFNPATNSEALANAVWYFKQCHEGFADTLRVSTTAYPKLHARESVSKYKLAALLGIPNRDDAMAMMGYLASVDGRFSESAISSAQLYSRDDNRINAVNSGNDTLTLSVYKKRAGASGWEDVVISGRAYQLVQRWIELTTPIRAYMKKNNIDGWRRLIIYVGTPMGKPAFFKSVSNINSTFRSFALRNSSQLGDLAELVTISRIRAQRGIIVFLEKFDVKAMARELGNEAATSMRHYLPDAIWNYFAIRWIRIFQNLLIVEATRDTPYMQRALMFQNAHELDEFLKNHATKSLIPEDSDDLGSVEKNATATSTDLNQPIQEVIVAASHGTFSILLSVKEAVKSALDEGKAVHDKALYWYEFTTRLESHIEAEAFKDRAIKKLLRDAAKTASPANYSKVIRA